LIRADFTFALRPVVNVRQPGTTRASQWKAAGSILPKTRNVAGRVDLSATDISSTKSDFLKLSVPTARRMLRFWLVRGATKTDA
jgi:hypothetical protein